MAKTKFTRYLAYLKKQGIKFEVVQLGRGPVPEHLRSLAEQIGFLCEEKNELQKNRRPDG